MEVTSVSQSKLSIFATAALLLIPAYSWKFLFDYWKKRKREYQQAVIFNKRHNCVVTYQSNKGRSGWPPDAGRIPPRSDMLLEDLYEPILYFIRTAEKSLDLAIMLINVKIIYMELVIARQRGIEIRIILNLQHNQSSKDQIELLMKKGIRCQFFVAPSTAMDSIMHNKFIVKDYNEEGGFVCTGSMNFTSSAVLNNYESFVFMSDNDVVKAFHNEFEECWNNISIDNEGLINKTILMDAQFNI